MYVCNIFDIKNEININELVNKVYIISTSLPIILEPRTDI